MTAEEKRNLERTALWEQTWNEDVERMIDEVYAENCEVRNMFNGFTARGRDSLRAVEREIQRRAPGRKMLVTRKIASGNVVALEAEGHLPNGVKFDACVFLTFDENGQVVSDHSYAYDPTGATNVASG